MSKSTSFLCTVQIFFEQSFNLVRNYAIHVLDMRFKRLDSLTVIQVDSPRHSSFGLAKNPDKILMD
jgi:hypothetical protein